MKGFKKGLLKRVTAIVLSSVILFGTVYSDYETAQAAEIVEAIYYTYWDLITSLYAACGYSTTIDPSVLSNHGVTGKQVWGNFCTWVELNAKAHYELLGEGLAPAIEELKGMASSVSAKGISMSQDLYDLLKSCFADELANNSVEVPAGNQFDDSNYYNYLKVVASVCGTSYKSVRDYGFSQGFYLNIVRQSDGRIFYFTVPYKIVGLRNSGKLEGGYDVISSDGSTGISGGNGNAACFDGISYSVQKFYALKTDTFIMKNGIFCPSTVIYPQVSTGACPKEVPDVSPWIKNPSVPDEWRIVQPGETPDKDPEEQPDILPAIIPINPYLPDNPDSTENPDKDPDSTENPDKDPDSTENPGKDPDSDPDKDKNPATLPGYNPDTGRYIDPSTGWEIDPSTGQLINPETGKLVNPETPDIVNQAESAGDITKVFPFCIPWDMMALVESLKADKEAPKFEFKYHFDVINYDFEVSVDMSDYWKYIKIFRWGMTIFFIIGLFFLTVKFTTFVYKMGS